MSDESALRLLARQAMQSGALPGRAPDHMWGGPGSGTRCPVCGKALSDDETELELQYAEHADGTRTFHTHVRCFAAWELERQGAGGADRSLPREGNSGIISVREHRTKKRGQGK